MCEWIVAGIIAFGHYDMPNQINGPYYSSCDTSYCKAAHVHCTPQARVSSILNEPTVYGYSVDYNYGLEPQPGRTTWSSSSSAYNHGSYRMK
jgi:hypothetical protein